MPDPAINPSQATRTLYCGAAHVGLLDARSGDIWAARPRRAKAAGPATHASLLTGGADDASTAEKDRFLCYWLHLPDAQTLGSQTRALAHGYPIEWHEAQLFVRLDPNWDHLRRQWIKSTDTRRIENNTDQQFAWGRAIFERYAALPRGHPLSWHLLGPRATDSMFYVQRVE